MLGGLFYFMIVGQEKNIKLEICGIMALYLSQFRIYEYEFVCQ